MTKKQNLAERDESIAKLRELLKPGDEVQTILRHISRSGMSRSISTVIKGEDRSYLVARALGERMDGKRGGMKVSGCGMDMGFHLVYNLSSVLFPDGFDCCGEGTNSGRFDRCPSNDHSNGDRNYSADHRHKSGGYALRHRWL